MNIEGQLYLSGWNKVVRQFSDEKKITYILGTDLSLEKFAIQREKCNIRTKETKPRTSEKDTGLVFPVACLLSLISTLSLSCQFLSPELFSWCLKTPSHPLNSGCSPRNVILQNYEQFLTSCSDWTDSMPFVRLEMRHNMLASGRGDPSACIISLPHQRLALFNNLNSDNNLPSNWGQN